MVSNLSGSTFNYVGLIADEPLRLVGLMSCFEGASSEGQAILIPVPGTVRELLGFSEVKCAVLYLDSSQVSRQMVTAIHRERPAVQLIVIGPSGSDEQILDSITAGARGFLDVDSTPEMLRRAIEHVMAGTIWVSRRLLSKLVDRLLRIIDYETFDQAPHLTDRESQVLELVLRARSNPEIALNLGINERTVKKHLGRLLAKTGAKTRIELSMMEFHRQALSAASAQYSRLSAKSLSGGGN